MRGDIDNLLIEDVSMADLQKLDEAGIDYDIDQDSASVDIFLEDKEDYLEAMVCLGLMEKIPVDELEEDEE